MKNAYALTEASSATQATRWTPAEDLLIEEIGDEILVLDRATGRIHQFNYTTGIVWKGLMNGAELDDIARAIVDQFDVPMARAKKDAEEMIGNFRILKLLDEKKAELSV